MKLPQDAEVKPFEEADLGNLLVGRFREADPNFVAIRAQLQVSTAPPIPYLAILTPWVDKQPLPYLCGPIHGVTNVLDLGKEWSIDVPVGESAPDFQGGVNSILIRSGSGFFIHLRTQKKFLDVQNGLAGELPNNTNIATWSTFTVNLHQKNVIGPGAEIMCWPQPEVKP